MKINLKRTKIFLLFIVFTTLSFAQEKPNVLLIIADDMRTELNCYGADYIHSPNIDNLAKNGVIFDHAYVQQAVCAASRASLLSGTRPNTTGVDYPYSKYFVNDFWPKHPMIAEYFEQNGYYAHTFGKIHHGPSDNLKTTHYMPKTGLNRSDYALPENIKKGGESGRGQATPPYECADVPDEAYVDGLIAQEAVKVLSQQKEKKEPFFLAVGFKKPHLPFVAPKKYWDLYDESKIPLAPNRYHPENAPLYATSHNAIANYAGLNYYNSPNNVLPEDYQRKLIHAYAACISFIDAQVGKLIESLKETGKYDNTVIVFISDHGFHLGHQQMWGKSTVFENATRAPLIVSAPNYTKGKRSTRFVEYVDIYATLCDLAGIKTPDYTEGTSFKPLLINPQKEWKKATFSQFPRGSKMEGYSIRTDEFRYTEWRNPNGTTDSIELYDHRENDIESINIAYNEGNESIINELAKQLNAGWKAALPEGVENNSNNPIAPPHINWSNKKITVNSKKTITFKSGKVTKLWKPTEGYKLSVKNQLLHIDVEHDANYWKKMQVSDLNVKATNNSVLKLAYKTIDNEPLTLAYHISSGDNWGELSSISLPSTNGEIQDITIQLSSDISKWEDKFEKMEAIEEIIFCINPNEKFKGTLVLESLTIE